MNEDSEMELISIELINPQKQKVEGLMLHYGAELGKDFGRLGCSTTMIFASEGKISDGVHERISRKLSGRVFGRIEETTEGR